MAAEKISIDEKLAESGLTKADARQLGLKLLSAAEVVALDKSFDRRSAIYIPYRTPEGKDTGFFRIRYLEAPTGFKGKKEKVQKYAQPANTLPSIYLSDYKKAEWRKIFSDPETPLYVTEGEFKAAAAVKAGLPTLGLGGVYAWRSTKAGVPFLDELESVNWVNRTVYLVFDSDLTTNPNVQRALVHFSKVLTDHGALPYIVHLPGGKDGAKVGLDDYLVEHGVKNFLKLAAEADPYEDAQALWELNQEVAFIENPLLVIRLSDGLKMNLNGFKDGVFANRHFWELSYDKEGNEKMAKKPLAPAWVKWEHRYCLGSLTYQPGETKVIDAKAYNDWPGWGVEPKKGDIRPWRQMLDHLFNKDKAAISWFERWCAVQVQQPGIKLTTAVALWGLYHGTGKSFIGYTLGRIFGKNFGEINQKHLSADNNDWSANKQFILGDDLTDGGNKRVDAGIMRSMITRKTIWINIKYIPSYEIPDCLNYYFTSNHPDAFFIEDRDRRYFIWEVIAPPLTEEFYKLYERWHEGEGPAALFHYLLNLDLGDFNPKAPAPLTEAKKNMIRLVKSDLGAWVADLIEDPAEMLTVGGRQIGADLWETGQLLRLYDPDGSTKVTANGLGRELRRAGVPQLPVACAGKKTRRLNVVRNKERWLGAGARALSRHWEEHFGETKRKY